MTVTFKGTREGLLITFGEGGWHDLLNELAMQLDRPGAQSFFHGARVLLETGDRALGVTELEELIALLAQHNMTLTSVLGQARAQETLDQLRASLPPSEPAESIEDNVAASDEAPAELPQALVIRRTVRSGQVIRHAGTVLILGDVNPGAQVIAEGDVLVWGKLRGVVHAGASGDENAMVGALILTPTQLRIGGQIARAPDGKRPRNAPAEIARVRNGQIVVEPWSGL
ncbi:MAG: septum site-determining protein MinC [Chloroflexi bacterium]|nr:septum site-determining protein MinC [Chloroflexota bacterium]